MNLDAIWLGLDLFAIQSPENIWRWLSVNVASHGNGITLPNTLIVELSVETWIARDVELLNIWVVGWLLQVIAGLDIVVAILARLVALDNK